MTEIDPRLAPALQAQLGNRRTSRGACTSTARFLGAIGERLRAGDRIITGSIVQVAIQQGSEVMADLAGLGSVGLTVG